MIRTFISNTFKNDTNPASSKFNKYIFLCNQKSGDKYPLKNYYFLKFFIFLLFSFIFMIINTLIILKINDNNYSEIYQIVHKIDNISVFTFFSNLNCTYYDDSKNILGVLNLQNKDKIFHYKANNYTFKQYLIKLLSISKENNINYEKISDIINEKMIEFLYKSFLNMDNNFHYVNTIPDLKVFLIFLLFFDAFVISIFLALFICQKKILIYIFYLVSFTCALNNFLNFEILLTIFNYNYYDFHSQFILPMVKYSFTIIWFLLMDSNFFINLLAFIITQFLNYFFCLGTHWDLNFKYIYLIIIIFPYAFFIYYVNKIKKNYYIILENTQRDLEKTKNIVQNLNSGILVFKKDLSCDFNKKYTQIIQTELFNKKSFYEYMNKILLFTKIDELNTELDENIIDIFKKYKYVFLKIENDLRNSLNMPYNKHQNNLDWNFQTSRINSSLRNEKDKETYELIKKRINQSADIEIKNFINFLFENIHFDEFIYLGRIKIHNNLNTLTQENIYQIYIRNNFFNENIEFLIYDITSVKKIEDYLAQNKYKKMFLNKFSHEFLNPILNMTQLTKNIRSTLTDTLAIINQNQRFNNFDFKKNFDETDENLDHIKNICNFMSLLISDFDFVANANIQHCSNDNSFNKFNNLDKLNVKDEEDDEDSEVKNSDISIDSDDEKNPEVKINKIQKKEFNQIKPDKVNDSSNAPIIYKNKTKKILDNKTVRKSKSKKTTIEKKLSKRTLKSKTYINNSSNNKNNNNNNNLYNTNIPNLDVNSSRFLKGKNIMKNYISNEMNHFNDDNNYNDISKRNKFDRSIMKNTSKSIISNLNPRTKLNYDDYINNKFTEKNPFPMIREKNYVNEEGYFQDAGHEIKSNINNKVNLNNSKCKLEINRFDIKKTVKTIIKIFRTKILLAEKLIQLNYEIDAGVPCKITNDQIKLKQIIFNLLSNSFKFTNNGIILIKLIIEDYFLVFLVSDTGIGIKSEHLNLLGLPFFKAESSNNCYGIGMGLHIVKSHTELLGGNFQIISDFGYGTTVNIKIPVNPLKKENICSLSEQSFNEKYNYEIIPNQERNFQLKSIFENNKYVKIRTDKPNLSQKIKEKYQVNVNYLLDSVVDRNKNFINNNCIEKDNNLIKRNPCSMKKNFEKENEIENDEFSEKFHLTVDKIRDPNDENNNNDENYDSFEFKKNIDIINDSRLSSHNKSLGDTFTKVERKNKVDLKFSLNNNIRKNPFLISNITKIPNLKNSMYNDCTGNFVNIVKKKGYKTIMIPLHRSLLSNSTTRNTRYLDTSNQILTFNYMDASCYSEDESSSYRNNSFNISEQSKRTFLRKDNKVSTDSIKNISIIDKIINNNERVSKSKNNCHDDNLKLNKNSSKNDYKEDLDNNDNYKKSKINYNNCNNMETKRNNSNLSQINYNNTKTTKVKNSTSIKNKLAQLNNISQFNNVGNRWIQNSL